MKASVPLVLKHKISRDAKSFHNISVLVDVFPSQLERIGLTPLVNSQRKLETAMDGRALYHGKNHMRNISKTTTKKKTTGISLGLIRNSLNSS